MTDVLINRVNAFLKSNQLSEYFNNHGWTIYDNMYVVDAHVIEHRSMDTKFSIKLLICSACSFCDSTHVRNVCVQKFFNDCLYRPLKSMFPNVLRMKVIHTSDERYDTYVAQMGGISSGIFDMDTVYPSDLLKRLFMSHHPMIDAGLQFLVGKNDPSSTSVPPPQDRMSVRNFLKKYRVCWIIDDQSKVIGNDRSIFEGMLSIVSNMDRLWSNITVARGPDCFFICAEGQSSFNPEIYRTVLF